MLRSGKYKTLGLAGLLAIMAMVVVASVGAASASAAPAFQRCAKVWEPKTGNFEDGKCTKKVAGKEFIRVVRGIKGQAGEECAKVVEPNTGNYKDNRCSVAEAGAQFIRVAEGKFGLRGAGGVGNGGGAGAAGGGKLETKNTAHPPVECESNKATGEITGERTSTATVTFEKCTAKKSGVTLTCTTSGQASGNISSKLDGELVYTSEALKTVGILFTPAETEFANFKCEGSSILGKVEEAIKVKGSVICPITPTNTLTSTFTLDCDKAAGAGAEEPEEYEEGGTKHSTSLETEGVGKGTGSETWSYEKSSEEAESTLTTEEEGEIGA